MAQTALFEEIWDSHKLRWYGWALKGLRDLSKNSTAQFFWITMASSAKGLSNTGQDALAALGFSLQSKAFRRLEAEHLQLRTKQIREQVEDTPHVWWIDNFNRAYGQTFYKLNDDGPLKVLNWTGWAMHLLPQTVMPSIYKHHPSILPFQLQTFENRKLFHDSVRTVTTTKGTVRSYFGDSFCEINNVYNVPVKPYRISRDVREQDLNRMARHNDGLANFVPIQMIRHNVSSDKGLANVLLQLSSSYHFGTRKTYSICKVDVNIFWRLYLVGVACQ